MKRGIALCAAMALLTAYGVSAQTPAQPAAQPAAPASTQPLAPAGAQPTATAAAKPPAAAPAKPDPWHNFRFLVGSWEAKTTGGVAQAHVATSYSFRMELREYLMARHARNGTCSAPDDYDCQHSDLLYIYPTGNGSAFEAIYFDNEGHIIRYSLTSPKPGTAVFLSDPALPGPQYRLSYTFLNEVMSGQFEMKMPGQADFTSYLEWSGKRQ